MGSSFAQDPTGEERSLLPICVDDCQPTGMLTLVQYVDVAGISDAEAEQLVLSALKERNKSATRPSFPGSTPAPKRALSKDR
ncbi:MAG: hypothetical protein ACFB0E_22455 [Leptolyngbyaceae cyanobacterium]